jgi:hypothetical protein
MEKKNGTKNLSKDVTLPDASASKGPQPAASSCAADGFSH